MKIYSLNEKIGEQEIILKSGRLAKQANGSVEAWSGDTAVLATACAASEDRPDIDFLPLQVEYNEKYYSAGKIPGGFFKREGRPKEREILVSRLIDRPIRPLFSKKIKREIQIIPTVLSVDQQNSPDILAINCASAAITISDIPFDGPIGAVRVAAIDNTLVVNPTVDAINNATLDIVVAGTLDGITMVEGGASEVSEELFLEAIELARQPIVALCNMQLKLAEKVGVTKFALSTEADATEVYPRRDECVTLAKKHLAEPCFVKGKHVRDVAISNAKAQVLDELLGDEPDDEELATAKKIIDEVEKGIVRDSILSDGVRTDGRSTTDIRPISCEIDMLPRTHGSSLFTRGETQSLSVVTLGTADDEQIRDDITGDRRDTFMLHYNFPPFSVGETGRMGTGRREIGHGELAFRALKAMMPNKAEFPYTVRVVSEILESNGSSSMATVCAGSLALMHAGVPIPKPVAGIAMGLISDGDKQVVLSDILGVEDHLGDMDFKVAGTKDGITAFQMDIKLKNVDSSVMQTALKQAKEGRLKILKEMSKAISKPNKKLSQYAPRIITFTVDQEVIGTLIGPGGKTIKSINERFSVTTNIEDSGTITVYCSNAQDGEDAKDAFLKLLEEPEIGKSYDGEVKRIVDFGAFIEYLPGKEGLCHISKMSERRIDSVEEVLKLNQVVRVKIIEIDKMKRVNLALLDEADKPFGVAFTKGSHKGRR